MTTRRAAAAALAGATLTALTALAACAEPVPLPAGPGAPLADEWPQDRTFLSTSVTENGVPRALIEGTRIRLSFHEESRISGNAGCNHVGGTAHLRDGRLVVTDMAMTEMACPGGRMDQDSWVFEFLGSSPTMRLSGDGLTLTGDTMTIVLMDRRVADPDRPLAGTRWVVDTIFDGEVASSVPQEAPAVLVIEAGGAFQATTGCAGGELRGTASVSSSAVTFTVTGQTPCTGQANDLDEAVRATLSGERSYEITARSLRLLGPGGSGLGLNAES
jgi:heat shock protein HslJ